MQEAIRKKLKVPNLVGIDVTNALVILRAAGFINTDVRYAESYEPRLRVIDQVPSRGQIVDSDERVQLVVSQQSLIRFLPTIYQRDQSDGSNTLKDFLWIFQHVLDSVETKIESIHTYFDPYEAPEDFLPWLASWVAFTLDENWPEEKKRYLIKRAVDLYRIRGTSKGLKVFLKLFTGVEPRILENQWPFQGFQIGVHSTIGVDSVILPPIDKAHTFIVEFPLHADEVADDLIIQIHDVIRAQKPAHSTYFLQFRGERRDLSSFGIVIGEHAVGSGMEITQVDGEEDEEDIADSDIGFDF